MSSVAQVLREQAALISICLDGLASPPRAATPAQISSLLSGMLAARAALQSQPLPADDCELQAAFEQYRRQLQRLSDLLPAIHRALLAEHARIEAQRSRLRSAAAWAGASRQTL